MDQVVATPVGHAEAGLGSSPADTAEEAKPPPRRALTRRPSPAPQATRGQSSRPQPARGSRPRAGNRTPVNPRTDAFRRRFFPEATVAEWNDWRWQVRNRIRDLAGLERIFALSADERAAVLAHDGPLPVGITPYYASLMGLDDPTEALRRTHIPVSGEHLRSPGEEDDPLGEDHDTVVPGLVHRYPDRVLFLTTPFCSTYCRYCTRARMVGETGEYTFGVSAWERALGYIESHTEVRDVLLSGGDPLALHDDKLEHLLRRLRAIPHVEFVRIGTKMPAVLPMRVTRDLARMLARYQPWISIHFTHPDEITPEVATACARLADAGLPLGSQTVLLKGINDDVETMRRLVHGLLRNRVRPYYLYQCDPIKGSAHFRTSVDKGLEIIRGLRGHTTGYAVPTYVVDAPGGGGKIPLIPDPVVGRDGDDLLLRNFEGAVHRYPDPEGTLGRALGGR
ncbi:MAG: KamA family radical SAM protein [Ectothiorhodospiraceae bacterium]|nr:KamA family radical SAM protein [Ectothiorhodospiraceae bacterium]